ncbi:MAG: DNA-3-methyladenine glycosylase family protein [Bacteroidota bacterium]
MAHFIWNIPSRPPHDFFLCLDVDSYFDYEHNPESIFDHGFTRPVPLKHRDILVTVFFNGDAEAPEFSVKAHEPLSDSDQAEADAVLRRILGADLDLAPLYRQAADDPVLSPLFSELYGLKRISRAHFFEDAVNRIIQTQIKHKPTARKMVYEVRSAYGTRLESDRGMVPAWPRPERLITADPVAMKRHGLSLRKGEYLVGLAEELLHGHLAQSLDRSAGPQDVHEGGFETGVEPDINRTLQSIESIPPRELYEMLVSVRGIGPTTAQDLILFRNRADGWFASHIERGREKAVRRWIILSYGGNPDRCSEDEFQEMIQRWKGYEATALEFLYVNWVLSEKRSAGGQ